MKSNRYCFVLCLVILLMKFNYGFCQNDNDNANQKPSTADILDDSLTLYDGPMLNDENYKVDDTIDELTANLSNDTLSPDETNDYSENIEKLIEKYDNTYIKNGTWFNGNDKNPSSYEIIETVQDIVDDFENNRSDPKHHDAGLDTLIETIENDRKKQENIDLIEKQHEELTFGLNDPVLDSVRFEITNDDDDGDDDYDYSTDSEDHARNEKETDGLDTIHKNIEEIGKEVKDLASSTVLKKENTIEVLKDKEQEVDDDILKDIDKVSTDELRTINTETEDIQAGPTPTASADKNLKLEEEIKETLENVASGVTHYLEIVTTLKPILSLDSSITNSKVGTELQKLTSNLNDAINEKVEIITKLGHDVQKQSDAVIHQIPVKIQETIETVTQGIHNAIENVKQQIVHKEDSIQDIIDAVTHAPVLKQKETEKESEKELGVLAEILKDAIIETGGILNSGLEIENIRDDIFDDIKDIEELFDTEIPLVDTVNNNFVNKKNSTEDLENSGNSENIYIESPTTYEWMQNPNFNKSVNQAEANLVEHESEIIPELIDSPTTSTEKYLESADTATKAPIAGELYDKGMEIIKTAVNYVNEKTDSVKEMIKDQIISTKEATQFLIDQDAQKMNESIVAVKNQLHKAEEKLQETVEKVKETIQQTGIPNRAYELLNNTVQYINDKTKTVGEIIRNNQGITNRSDLKNYVNNVKGQLKETFENVTQGIQDVIHNVEEHIKETGVPDKTHEMLNSAVKYIDEKKKEVNELVNEQMTLIIEGAESINVTEKIHHVGETLHGAYDTVTEGIHNVIETVQGHIKESVIPKIQGHIKESVLPKIKEHIKESEIPNKTNEMMGSAIKYINDKKDVVDTVVKNQIKKIEGIASGLLQIEETDQHELQETQIPAKIVELIESAIDKINGTKKEIAETSLEETGSKIDKNVVETVSAVIESVQNNAGKIIKTSSEYVEEHTTEKPTTSSTIPIKYLDVQTTAIPTTTTTKKSGLFSRLSALIYGAMNAASRNIPSSYDDIEKSRSFHPDGIENFNEIMENGNMFVKNNLTPDQIDDTAKHYNAFDEIEKIVDPEIKEEFLKDLLMESNNDNEGKFLFFSEKQESHVTEPPTTTQKSQHFKNSLSENNYFINEEHKNDQFQKSFDPNYSLRIEDIKTDNKTDEKTMYAGYNHTNTEIVNNNPNEHIDDNLRTQVILNKTTHVVNQTESHIENISGTENTHNSTIYNLDRPLYHLDNKTNVTTINETDHYKKEIDNDFMENKYRAVNYGSVSLLNETDPNKDVYNRAEISSNYDDHAAISTLENEHIENTKNGDYLEKHYIDRTESHDNYVINNRETSYIDNSTDHHTEKLISENSENTKDEHIFNHLDKTITDETNEFRHEQKNEDHIQDTPGSHTEDHIITETKAKAKNIHFSDTEQSHIENNFKETINSHNEDIHGIHLKEIEKIELDHNLKTIERNYSLDIDKEGKEFVKQIYENEEEKQKTNEKLHDIDNIIKILNLDLQKTNEMINNETKTQPEKVLNYLDKNHEITNNPMDEELMKLIDQLVEETNVDMLKHKKESLKKQLLEEYKEKQSEEIKLKDIEEEHEKLFDFEDKQSSTSPPIDMNEPLFESFKIEKSAQFKFDQRSFPSNYDLDPSERLNEDQQTTVKVNNRQDTIDNFFRTKLETDPWEPQPIEETDTTFDNDSLVSIKVDYIRKRVDPETLRIKMIERVIEITEIEDKNEIKTPPHFIFGFPIVKHQTNIKIRQTLIPKLRDPKTGHIKSVYENFNITDTLDEDEFDFTRENRILSKFNEIYHKECPECPQDPLYREVIEIVVVTFNNIPKKLSNNSTIEARDLETETIPAPVDESNETLLTLVEAFELTGEITKSIDSFRDSMEQTSEAVTTSHKTITAENINKLDNDIIRVEEVLEIENKTLLKVAELNKEGLGLGLIIICSLCTILVIVLGIVIFFKKTKRFGGVDFVPV